MKEVPSLEEMRARQLAGLKKAPVAANDRVLGRRPTIEIGSDLTPNVDQLVDALSADATLFQRDHDLVHVIRATESDKKGGWSLGSPLVRRVRPANLFERASTVAEWTQWVKSRSGEMQLVTRLPSKAVVEAAAARGEWPGIRPLVGISEIPFLRLDGTVCDRAGYDSLTGYLLEPNIEIEPLPPYVTQEMARVAWLELCEPFAQFPWASEASKSAAIASVLTLIGRPGFEGPPPAFLLNKNTPGTGGTLCADIISLISSGRTADPISFPPSSEEMVKVLGGLALGAAQFVCFDNIDTDFGGGPLNQALTARSLQFRRLGQSETPAMLWKAVIFGTGNNITVVGDTVRRVLDARMNSPLERPEERTGFDHPNLRAWVKENRARLVRAALLVLRGFTCAGRPSQNLREWGSFEAWSELIANAVAFAGGVDVMGARMLTLDVTSDPLKAAMLTFVRRLPALSSEGITLKAMIASLYSADLLAGRPVAPDGFDDLRGALETIADCPTGKAPNARKIGEVLRRHKDRNIDGRWITSKEDRNGVAVWKLQTAGAGSEGSAGSLPYKTPDPSHDVDVRGPGLNLTPHTLLTPQSSGGGE